MTTGAGSPSYPRQRSHERQSQEPLADKPSSRPSGPDKPISRLSRGQKRARWALAITALVGGALCLLPLVLAYVVQHQVLPQVGERFGVLLSVRDVQVRPSRVRLHSLVVRSADGRRTVEPLKVAQVEVEFAPLALLHGQVELLKVTLTRAQIQVLRGGEDDNISAILERLRGKTSATGEAGSEGRRGRIHGPQVVVVEAAEVDVRDELGAAHVTALDATLHKVGDCEVVLRDASVEPAGSTAAQAGLVRLHWQSPTRFVPGGLPEIEVQGGAVAPWKRLSMTGISGTIKPDEKDPMRAAITLAGGYGGVDKQLWQAHGWVQPEPGDSSLRKRNIQAELHVRAERFLLSQLEPILKTTPIIDAEKTEVDATLDLGFAQNVLTFAGGFHMAGLSVFSPRLVAEPVRDLGFDMKAAGRVDLKARRVKLERASVRWNGAEAILDAEAEAQPVGRTATLPTLGPDGKPLPPSWRERWRTVSLHLQVPPIDCQALLSAIPTPIVPRIKDFKVAGTFSTDVRVFVDFAKLLRLPPPTDGEEEDAGSDTVPVSDVPAPVIKKVARALKGQPATTPVKDPKDDPVQLSGQVGIGGCKVLKAPHEMDVARFMESFVHTVLVEPGRELSFTIGPENPDFVPFEDLSPHLLLSIMTTEDHGFLRHRGFIVPEFRSALQSNLERGYFRLGASSITMQMVKNVLLSREKTLSRKLQEMFLTWYIESNLTDDQDLIKALQKGYSVSQYRQMKAPKSAPIPPLAPPPENAVGLVASPVPAVSAPDPAQVAAAKVGAFPGSPLGVANQQAYAQALQGLKEISPIKKRILEIYFNAIEFGPYIYGIGRASRHYFGKSPKDLTAKEGAFFSSILPNPKRRYIQYCKGATDDGWEKYVDRIVRRIHSRGRMTDLDLQTSLAHRLVFDRTEAMPERECLALIQHLTELPPVTATAASLTGELPAVPEVSQRAIPTPPWISVSSGGKVRYKQAQAAAPTPEAPGPAPF